MTANPAPQPTAPQPTRSPLVDLTARQLAKLFDHSLLRPELTTDEVAAGGELAARYQVASVCVRPCDVARTATALAGSGVAVGTVVGFPHGSVTSRTKAYETADALANGATEIDMVVNIGWLRQGAEDEVLADISAVVREAAGAALVKVILENAYLTDDQKRRGCQLAEQAGADYVKTSTGFAPSGATLADVILMRDAVSPRIGVKAAGGVRTLDQVREMVAAGVTRIGATATAAILDEAARRAAGAR